MQYGFMENRTNPRKCTHKVIGRFDARRLDLVHEFCDITLS